MSQDYGRLCRMLQWSDLRRQMNCLPFSEACSIWNPCNGSKGWKKPFHSRFLPFRQATGHFWPYPINHCLIPFVSSCTLPQATYVYDSIYKRTQDIKYLEEGQESLLV